MNGRIQHKIDTSENWAKAENFIPLKGELIIYSDLRRIKIGDGNSYVNDLDFMDGSNILDQDNNLYYSTLHDAVADTNRVTDYIDAKVKVFTADNGRTTVMLLDNISENVQIEVNRDIDLILNGKILNLTTAEAVINFLAGTSCTINGEISGSKVIKEEFTTTAKSFTIVTNGTLVVNGGEYSLSGNVNDTFVLFRCPPGAELLKINGCTASIINTNINTEKNYYTKCIESQSTKTIVQNCTISAQGMMRVAGLQASGDITVERSTLRTKATGNTTQTFSVTINNVGNLNIKDSTVFADAADCHTDATYSQGIRSEGTLVCTNVDVHGTHSAVSNHGKLYVNGGTYTGFCHGGFYLAHGSNGIAYINDATILCGNYAGEFDYSNKDSEIYGAMYIGGGTAASHSNITVYIDGCTISPVKTPSETRHVSIVLRGTSGETNNTVNISNSTITNGSRIRIDNMSNNNHKLNIGVGTKILNFYSGDNSTMELIDFSEFLENHDPEFINNPELAEFTAEFYRKVHEDKVLDGNDFKAIMAYCSVASGDEVSY